MKTPRGIRRVTTGYRVYGRVKVPGQAKGVFFSHIIPWRENPTEESCKAWRKRKRAEILAGVAAPTKPAAAPGFRADVAEYLKTIAALPTIDERTKHMAEWVAVFGDRPRDAIESREIRQQRDRWLTKGPRCEWKKLPNGTHAWVLVDKPLAPSSVNHRLRALQNFFTVMNGTHRKNPVVDVEEADEALGPPRAIPPAIIHAILHRIPDRGRPVKDQSRDIVSLTKARLGVLAWTGLPPAQIMLLEPGDIDVAGKSVYVRRRKKGHGVVGGRRPVTSQGAKALKAFVAADAWGGFSTSSARKTFKRAAAALERELAERGVVVDFSDLTPYDLRHSFATDTLAATHSVDALAALAGHADRRTSLRYSQAAVPAYLAAAAAQLGRLRSRKLQEKLQGARKPRQR